MRPKAGAYRPIVNRSQGRGLAVRLLPLSASKPRSVGVELVGELGFEGIRLARGLDFRTEIIERSRMVFNDPLSQSTNDDLDREKSYLA